MRRDLRRVVIQIALFITTFITTTLAGTSWISGKSIFFGDFSWSDFVTGLSFSIPFLLILTVHEFGHYFVAMYHKVRSTLPYYIPLPPIPFWIGTLGAVIRLEYVLSKKKNFDIGIAGPLAGFIAAFFILWYGFATLPPAEHIFEIHPEYKQYGLNYAEEVYKNLPKNSYDVLIGKNLLFQFFESFVADPSRVPNPREIMHYPILFGGFLALVFTFLNLMPIGQLDGGHILYGLVGHRRHKIIASILFVAFMFYAGLGLEYINPNLPLDTLAIGIGLYALFLYFAFTGLKLEIKETIMYTLLVLTGQFLLMIFIPGIEGFPGWLLFGVIVSRLVGIAHPECEIEEPLDRKRIILGWLALIIFILCFSPAPMIIKLIT
jgi:membrane-associated protease RseP (regulator of RpoE activity)